jgi:amino-acid N-acetyltransferase
MPLTVEVARPHELGVVLALLRSMDLTVSGVAEHLGHYLVARDDESVIGTCGVEVIGRDGLIQNLAVIPERRNEGVEALLIARAEELARQMDLGRLFAFAADGESEFRRLGYAACAHAEAPSLVREGWRVRMGDSNAPLMKKQIR